MELSPDELFKIIGIKEVEILLLKSEMTKKDDAIKEMEKRLAAVAARKEPTDKE